MLFFFYIIYLRFGGPPRVKELDGFAAGLAAPPAPVVPVADLVGTFDLAPGRGNLTPNARSNLVMMAGFGTAFPDSYSATTCGFSLIAVAKSFCVNFFAVRA